MLALLSVRKVFEDAGGIIQPIVVDQEKLAEYIK
jgi:hypothetical protein